MELEGSKEQNAGTRRHSGKAPGVIQLCDTQSTGKERLLALGSVQGGHLRVLAPLSVIGIPTLLLLSALETQALREQN